MAATTEQIHEDVRAIIAEIIEVDAAEVTPDAHLVQDLGADSMAALELMAALERKFSVTIEPEHFPELGTLRQTAALIEQLAR